MPFGRWAWHGLLSPNGGAGLLVIIICTATAGAVKVKVCSHLRWGRIFRKPRLYAYPAGADFCSCASSRATLHVRSLFPWNRQPSNAPPLLLSPTGRATRRGPQMQNTLGDTPRHPRSSGATSASIGQTLRYTAGSPLRCGAPSSPHKVLRPCGDPISPLGTAAPSRSVG